MKMDALTVIGHGIKDYAEKMRKADLLNALHEDIPNILELFPLRLFPTIVFHRKSFRGNDYLRQI